MRVRHLPSGAVYIELEDGDLDEDTYNHKREVGERFREPVYGRFWIEVSPRAVELLGRQGRLLSATKAAYMLEHAGHDVPFNACIFDRQGTEVWFGDLDLTLEEARLKRLAGELGVIYVTPEQPYRWRGLPAPGGRGRAGIRRFARKR